MSTVSPPEQFLHVLQEQGGRAANGKLRERLGLSEQAYTELRDGLVAQGAIIKGRGQGGTVALADPTLRKAVQPDLLETAVRVREHRVRETLPVRPAATAPAGLWARA